MTLIRKKIEKFLYQEKNKKDKLHVYGMKRVLLGGLQKKGKRIKSIGNHHLQATFVRNSFEKLHFEEMRRNY